MRYGSALLIVMGQAVRARRIKTASAESPSWRLSLSSSIFIVTARAGLRQAADRTGRQRPCPLR